MRHTLLIATAAAAWITAAAARADEVTDAMAEAQRAYGAGQMEAAQTALQEALQLLAQRAAAGLAAALPAPLPGWTQEEDGAGGNAAVGMFGGASASRSYRNAEGQTVELQLMRDNPMIAQVAGVLANPMVVGAMGRLVRIGDQRAVQMHDGTMQMLIDNRILVLITGSATPEAKVAYARAIDAARLSRR